MGSGSLKLDNNGELWSITIPDVVAQEGWWTHWWANEICGWHTSNCQGHWWYSSLQGIKLSSKRNFVGSQVNDWEFRSPTTMPGLCKGKIMHTNNRFPRKSTAKKVDGTEVWTCLDSRDKRIRKCTWIAELWHIAGLGANVMGVYQYGQSNLKSIFNIMESLWAYRDKNGWKIWVNTECDWSEL